MSSTRQASENTRLKEEDRGDAHRGKDRARWARVKVLVLNCFH